MATRSRDDNQYDVVLKKEDFDIVYNQLFPARIAWCNIGISLKLDLNTLSNIDHQCRGHNDEALTRMLHLWLDTDQSPTWEKLCISLCTPSVSKNVLARQIQEFVKKQAEISRTTVVPIETSLSEMEPNKRRPSERSSGQVRSGGGIDVEIKEFKQKFRDLRKAALKELTAEDCKIPVSEFRRAFLLLPDSIARESEIFILSKYNLFEEAKSIENILAHLSFYLSFIDFDLLEYIIEEFGSKRLKKDMKGYAHDMTQFKARTTISDALKYLPKPKLSDRTSLPEGLSDLTIEFDVDVNIATLETLDELRKIHADEFQLSHLAFYLFKLQKRSLLVTWFVPASLETRISDKIQEKNVSFFSSNNILELSLGGKQLYPFKKEINQPETSSHQCPEGHSLTRPSWQSQASGKHSQPRPPVCVLSNSPSQSGPPNWEASRPPSPPSRPPFLQSGPPSQSSRPSSQSKRRSLSRTRTLSRSGSSRSGSSLSSASSTPFYPLDKMSTYRTRGVSLSSDPSSPPMGLSFSDPQSVHDVTLTVHNTKTVFELLNKARKDWYFIGEGIGCTLTDLHDIKAKYSANQQRLCLLEMFQRRLQQGGLTRSMLCKTLRREFVGRDDVAREIEALDLKQQTTL